MLQMYLLFSLLEVNTYNSKMVAYIAILDLNMLSSFWCQLVHTHLHVLISSPDQFTVYRHACAREDSALLFTYESSMANKSANSRHSL